MTACVSNSVKHIIGRMAEAEYGGDMRCRHLAVAIRSGIPITDFKVNYIRDMVFGEYRGSVHAEMNVIEDILRLYSPEGGLKNYFPWFIAEEVQSKGESLLWK